MADKIKVAVVGVGEFGRQHARVYRTLEEAELVGVFDTDPDRAQAVAKEYETRAFASLDEVAQAARAVSVAVPTRDHARVGLELLRRGCDVLVEKPIAVSLPQADEMIETAEKLGRILMVAYPHRYRKSMTSHLPKVMPTW